MRWLSAISQHSAASTASAGRSTSMLGIARNEARYSTGWWVGPLRADADGVMAEHELHRQAHHGRDAQRRPHVVGEDQIGDADRHHAAMRRHAVQHRAHRVLADAVMDVAAAAVLGGEGGELALVLRGALEVRRAGEQLRDGVGQQIDDVARES